MTPALLARAGRGLIILLILCVVAAVWLSWRDVELPGVSEIDDSIKDGEPRHDESDQRVFEITIKGYTYALTRRATYDIAGLVVSQHRGDAFANLYNRIDQPAVGARDVAGVGGSQEGSSAPDP